ncbi:NOB1 family endonuclease [Acidianus brierleyi]|uniref:DNA-binding protein n=1 Tax=Acidianus brierleyi TaxID=41673 RepID=A0A2U9IBR0_9CREN|nr:NOB1 family endonuclease [Acidianus brierleyi]AWR93466.1 DNA-binding protein [Acidianus brierleyi]
MENVIFDTAGFLAGLENYFDRVYTTPLVMNEVKDYVSRSLLSLASSSGKIIILEPEKRNIDITNNTLRKIGEYSLSKTDISIIALALQLQPSIVFTDDFSVQNILLKLGIKFNSVKLNRSIKYEREYYYVCENCGKVYQRKKESCDICGGKIIKKSKLDSKK